MPNVIEIRSLDLVEADTEAKRLVRIIAHEGAEVLAYNSSDQPPEVPMRVVRDADVSNGVSLLSGYIVVSVTHTDERGYFMKRTIARRCLSSQVLLNSGLVVVALIGAASWAETTDSELMRRPAQMVVLRAKGVSEPVFTPPRDIVNSSPKVSTATFIVDYNGFTPEAEAAFQAAVDVWASLISSPVPIRVEANWTPLEPGVLGSCGPNSFWNSSSLPSVFFPDALVDALSGSDVGGGDYDILANFNSDYDGWYFGADGNTPPSQYDFMTVVLHELGHGLGFVGWGWVESGQGGVGEDGQVFIYDLFTEDISGNVLIESYENPSTALASVLQGGHLYWGGENAVATNNGSRPRLYAPSVWDEGSSYSHLDEVTYPAGDPDSLMTPQLGWGSAIHDPGAITLCLFQDIGWTTAEDCGAGETVLTSGVPVSGSVGFLEWDRYTITVPSGATSLVVATSGTSADIDLYLRYGSAPTLNEYDYVAYTSSGNETITVTPSSSPQPLAAGTWYVGVYGYQASAYSIVATVTGGGGGCSYSIWPTSASYGASGGNGSVSVTTTAGCPWTASSNSGWIHVTSGASGTGSGTVGYRVDANSGGPRTGTMTIAGHTFTVTQSSGGSGETFTYQVAGIAHAGGAGGSVWRSTLCVTNLSGSTANLTLVYRMASNSVTRTHVLQSGRIKEWADVAVSLFNQSANTSGAIEITSDAPVTVVARTYNEAPDGTFGQGMPGNDDSETLASGQMGVLPQLKKTTAFRTNVGLMNHGSAACNVRIKLYSETGSQIGNTIDTSVPAKQWKQINDVFAEAGVGQCQIGYATVEVRTAGGLIWAYGSVVDNGTGDPTTIPLFIQ